MSLTKRYFHDKIVERDIDKSLHQLSQYDKQQQEFLNEKIDMQLHSSENIETLKVSNRVLSSTIIFGKLKREGCDA